MRDLCIYQNITLCLVSMYDYYFSIKNKIKFQNDGAGGRGLRSQDQRSKNVAKIELICRRQWENNFRGN